MHHQHHQQPANIDTIELHDNIILATNGESAVKHLLRIESGRTNQVTHRVCAAGSGDIKCSMLLKPHACSKRQTHKTNEAHQHKLHSGAMACLTNLLIFCMRAVEGSMRGIPKLL